MRYINTMSIYSNTVFSTYKVSIANMTVSQNRYEKLTQSVHYKQHSEVSFPNLFFKKE